MEILYREPSAAQLFIVLVCGIWLLIGTSLFIVIAGVFHQWLDRKRLEEFVPDESKLFDFVATADPTKIMGLRKSVLLRDYLVRLASRTRGEFRVKLATLYVALGFNLQDYKEMLGFNYEKQIKALERCRTMEVPIPEKYWMKFTTSGNHVFRWAVMELLIHSKGKQALPWLIGFLQEPENRRKGVMLHLLCCYAKIDSQAIAMLLEHHDDPDVREICLLAMALYPVPGAESLVASSFGKSSPPATVLAGIQAIIACPDPELLTFLCSLAHHASFRVRMVLAEAMMRYRGLDALQVLETLSCDPEHTVRMKAVQILMGWGDDAKATLEKIERDDLHPAHNIYLELETLRKIRMEHDFWNGPTDEHDRFIARVGEG